VWVTVVALQILLNDTYKLNHNCKEMGAKLDRRFLKQPAEKLKAVFVALSKPVMSNPNGLLSRKVCHYLNQGHTLNDIPCFPGNTTGLILIFTPKFTLGLIFGGCLILIYQKMKSQTKN